MVETQRAPWYAEYWDTGVVRVGTVLVIAGLLFIVVGLLLGFFLKWPMEVFVVMAVGFFMNLMGGALWRSACG